jgi:hypothetical protein
MILLGSKLLGLSNNKDTDYITINDETKPNGEKVDFGIRKLEWIENRLNFSIIDIYTLYNYQLDQSILKQDFPIKYNILDYRSELIDMLKKIVRENMFNFHKGIQAEGGNCSKMIYHIAYNVFIVQNNSPIITAEQKAIVQKIHDRQMPIDYLDTLAEMINNLE